VLIGRRPPPAADQAAAALRAAIAPAVTSASRRRDGGGGRGRAGSTSWVTSIEPDGYRPPCGSDTGRHAGRRPVHSVEDRQRPPLSSFSHLGRDTELVRILIVEDDPRMAAAMRRALASASVVADVVSSGAEAGWIVRESHYDAMVLDVMLPGGDGFDVCRALRAEGVWLPIIMVTARGAVEDRVRGLDAGADDYLTKPFSLAELLARLRALVRRDPIERPVELRVGSLTLDPASRAVARGGQPIHLSSREFALLETFMRHPGQVLSQRQLLDAAWDFAYEHRSNVVEVYIRYLRLKIDRPFGVHTLETLRGMGYRLTTGTSA
jgi:two-component system OmpR family response regulator